MSYQNKAGAETPKSSAPTPAEASTPPSVVPQEIIPPSLDSALRTAGIDPMNPEVSRALEISLTMMFSGSLPIAPPPILKEYQNIDPALVSKLVEWTELQAAHRRELEKLKTERAEDRYDRGQWIAGSVALGGLVLASLVAIFGNPWVAGVIAVVAVGGPTAAIWLARNVRNQAPQAPQKPPSRPNLPTQVS